MHGGIDMLPNRQKKNGSPVLAQEVIKKRSNLLWWLIPLLFLFLLILYWFFYHSESTVSHQPQSSVWLHDGNSKSLSNTHYVTLPDGVVIQINNDSVEAKLLKIIQNPNQQLNIDKIGLNLDRINFDSNKVSTGAQLQINNIAAILKAYPHVKIKIVGSTDNRGNAEQNKALSKARAEAIMKEFIKLKVADQQLVAEGDGENYPIASNETPEGRAKNRRVSISVIKIL
ncbi:MAG: OmpA family protein [Candidatus Dasytiphilus stammeri]